MSDWNQAEAPTVSIGPLGWLLALGRALLLVPLIYLGLVLLLVLRLVEIPFCGKSRPITPWITTFVCRNALRILGFGYQLRGKPMQQKGAVVANHASWLDILSLNAGQRVYFVSKAEVAKWPAIGWLARATGTVFIARKGTEAKRQQEVFEARLLAGHKLLFFPEGTSTDAVRVLPFKSTLFQAFFTPALGRVLYIQPVTVIYHAPEGYDPRFYGWWGDMSFGSHFLRVLTRWTQGRVELIYHPEVPVDAFANRKELALHCERVIRTSHSLAEA